MSATKNTNTASTSFQNEQFFDKDGFYHFVVQSNTALHQEAVDYGTAAIREVIGQMVPGKTLRVIDLACGKSPVSISQMMRNCADTKFVYIGIDINSSAVQAAKNSFQYPPNVVSQNVIEGNAWAEPPIILKNSFDIVFLGLSLHHGTPEELFVVFQRIRSLLTKGGVLINHDMFRPEEYKYIVRPDTNPENPSESFRMISAEDPELSKVPSFTFKGTSLKDIAKNSDWRQMFLMGFEHVLLRKGADPFGIEQAKKHVSARDFCLSTVEMSEILTAAGFKVAVKDYLNSDEPLKNYYATLIAK